MEVKIEVKSIHQKLYNWLQVLKDEFKSYESKEYDWQDGLSQAIYQSLQNIFYQI